MLDVETQARFNRSCADAVVNYLNASGAAYHAMAQQMLRTWGQSVDAMVEGAQRTQPSHQIAVYEPSRRSAAQGVGANCMMPWAAVPNAWMSGASPMTSMMPFGPANGYGMYSPWAQWMEMMMPRNATAWPMAVGMISFGVPDDVAWPTARGNAAAMDAFQLAAKSVEKAFTAYGYGASANAKPAYSTIERNSQPNPFNIAFAVMPYNPTFLMQFFMPVRPR